MSGRARRSRRCEECSRGVDNTSNDTLLSVCVIYIHVVYKGFRYHKVIGKRDVIDVMVVSSIFRGYSCSVFSLLIPFLPSPHFLVMFVCIMCYDNVCLCACVCVCIYMSYNSSANYLN